MSGRAKAETIPSGDGPWFFIWVRSYGLFPDVHRAPSPLRTENDETEGTGKSICGGG